jgi:hypothetical protein
MKVLTALAVGFYIFVVVVPTALAQQNWPTTFNALKVGGGTMTENAQWCPSGSYIIVYAQGKKPGTLSGKGSVPLTIPLVANGFGVSNDSVRFTNEHDAQKTGNIYLANFDICTHTVTEVNQNQKEVPNKENTLADKKNENLAKNRLTDEQVSAILLLLHAFGVNEQTIVSVEGILR